MGRKSKRQAVIARPQCYYCSRDFDNEEVLIQHQRATHFRCTECRRGFKNGPSMASHFKVAHLRDLDAIPRSDAGRADPALYIVGSIGVPPEVMQEWIEIAEAAAAAAAAAATAKEAAGKSADAEDDDEEDDLGLFPLCDPENNGGLVWSSDDVSPEEARASLPQYKFDADDLQLRLSHLNETVERQIDKYLERKFKLR